LDKETLDRVVKTFEGLVSKHQGGGSKYPDIIGESLSGLVIPSGTEALRLR
jgi:hypothetical protein